ncbi:tail fiber domain-containing protein [Citrobacter freundii]|uniref:Tail fiber domain-containing protein n=2 Tax=Citrobacter freundii TaxID=546 RepID=A0AAN4JEB6_CITFR|nr:tail fiber domain-containing protein [Citrobacter freundii]
MADIFNGGTVKLFYNLDTANQNVISSGNIEIENVATFPTFSISDSANKIETYDSEYTRTVVGDKAIGDLEIVVNYRPDSETHQFLDSAYDNKTEFQLIVNYIEDQDAGKVEAVIVSGNINSRMISGDKDDVVRMTYTYSPRTIISMGTRLIPPVLRRGDYGVGSDGTPDYPQYSPQEAEGNAFVMIPAADTDNPAGTDLYGIELVSQPTGQSNTNLMLTDSGDLRIYARNNTTPWSRVYTSGESDTLYLSKANNLSDLDNVITARSNLGILSTTENDARYMIGSRNLSELTDVTAARTKLGILDTIGNDARYLKSASNLSDLASVTTSKVNLQVDRLQQNATLTHVFTQDKTKSLVIDNNGKWGGYNSTTGAYIPLGVTEGGTGAWNASGARQNFELERYNQSPSETYIQSPDRQKYLTISNNSWGFYNTQNGGGFIPLGTGQGGTGATTVQQAKINLQIERLQQQDNGTFLRGNGTSNVGLFVQDGTWGAMNLSSGARIALPINNGGTGALDVNGARSNLGLGEAQAVNFGNVNVNQWSDAAQFNGGILSSTLLNTSNGTRSWSRFYSEIQADGIPKTTIHSGDGANRNAYLQFYCSGLLSGIETLGVNGKSRTGTLAVVDRMSVGTPGDATALGARSIAIGDSDTGFAQRGDGVLDVYADSVNVATFTPQNIQMQRQLRISADQTNAPIDVGTRTTGSGSFITGIVSGGGGWASWRDRPAGIIVQPAGENQVSSIWKCTQWGKSHYAAMGVYNPNPASDPVGTMVNLSCEGQGWYFYGSTGNATGIGWVSSSDQRLKTNIEPITGALDKLIKLNGYTYDKRSSFVEDEYTTTTHEAGLIAQEVQKVLPEAVSEASPDGMLGVSSYGVQALIINATKELNTKVETQAASIMVLSEHIQDQQQQIDELKALVQSLITK